MTDRPVFEYDAHGLTWGSLRLWRFSVWWDYRYFSCRGLGVSGSRLPTKPMAYVLDFCWWTLLWEVRR